MLSATIDAQKTSSKSADIPIAHRVAFELPDFTLPDQLPTDPSALIALMREQQATIVAIRAKAQDHIDYLYEQILLARRRMFGPSSEQSTDQARLFDEAELLAGMPQAPQADESESPDGASDTDSKKAKARGKRAPLPAELPRLDIVHELPEDQRLCACGTPMIEIGEEISEQLDIVPMKIQVLRHIRKRYACPDRDQPPVTAPMPAQPIPKSNASPALIAMLLAVKFVDGCVPRAQSP